MRTSIKVKHRTFLTKVHTNLNFFTRLIHAPHLEFITAPHGFANDQQS